MSYTLAEQKTIAGDIANNLLKVFQLDKFKDLINRFLQSKYSQGVESIEGQLKINVDYTKNTRNTEMLNEYVFDNIQGMTDEMQQQLRQELQRGILEQESAKELRERVSDIFRGNNPTRFRFEDRIKMIVRTEGKRAINMAKFQGALDSGRELWKYVRNGSRPCAGCKQVEVEGKIQLGQKFSFTINGKTTLIQYPPFHPNCMCNLSISQTKPDS